MVHYEKWDINTSVWIKDDSKSILMFSEAWLNVLSFKPDCVLDALPNWEKNALPC